MSVTRLWLIGGSLLLGALALAVIVRSGDSISRAAGALSIANVTDNRALYGESVPRFEKLEISFDLLDSVAENYQLPYDPSPLPGIPAGVGVTVDGLFSPDDWQMIFTQPAFYYQEFDYQIKESREWLYPTGNFSWKVRFAPDREGTWQYKLRATDATGTVETEPVSFLVIPSTNKGFIRVSQSDPRYFEHEDGSYFPGLGYNMNYDHVSWVNPVLGNQEHFQKMGDNGIQLVRIWLSQWAIYTSAWNPWNSIDPALHAQYIPYTGLTASQSYTGSEVSMQVSVSPNPCMFIGAWKAPPAVKRNTTYRVRVRYKTVGLAGPRVAGAPYGLVAKIGGWLWDAYDETRRCDYPGTGTVVTPYQAQDTADWEILEGALYTGNADFLPNFYLVVENATAGAAYVDYVWIEEVLGGGQYGPNIVSKPWMAHHLYFEQRNSYAFDKVLELARQHGVYLRPVILEKNEWIFNRIDYTGAFTDSPSNDYFYGDFRNQTKTRWLQRAWWRYLQARWGYSANVHSWELLNEGDPFNGRHHHLADELGAYMHQFEPDAHLVSTSTWHSFPTTAFWANADFPEVDFADVHLYMPSDSDTVLRFDNNYYLVSPVADFYDTALADNNLNQLVGAGAAFWPGKPVVRGETGFIEGGSWQPIPQLAADSQGIWLHNFVWAGISSGGLIESYWYETHHIYSRKSDGTYNFDHRPHFGGYYRFIKDIPLNNGLYEDAQAQVSEPNLRVWGQKDVTHGNAHLWIANANHTWKNVVDQVPIPAVSGTVVVAGFAPYAICSLEWWDAYAGSVASTASTTTDAAGDLTLTIEDLTNDTAVKIACPLRLADVVTSKQLIGAPASPGEEMDYRISYINQGDGMAWDVTISDTLPPGVTYVADWPEEGKPGAVVTGPTLV